MSIIWAVPIFLGVAYACMRYSNKYSLEQIRARNDVRTSAHQEDVIGDSLLENDQVRSEDVANQVMDPDRVENEEQVEIAPTEEPEEIVVKVDQKQQIDDPENNFQ
jgi:hypothetical protein